MEVPTLRESTCKRKVAYFHSMVERRETLTAPQRSKLMEEMQAFVESLSTATVVLAGAGVGLGAAVLPVIGLISGPVIGGVVGAYRSYKLAPYRHEVQALIQELGAG